MKVVAIQPYDKSQSILLSHKHGKAIRVDTEGFTLFRHFRSALQCWLPGNLPLPFGSVPELGVSYASSLSPSLTAKCGTNAHTKDAADNPVDVDGGIIDAGAQRTSCPARIHSPLVTNLRDHSSSQLTHLDLE